MLAGGKVFDQINLRLCKARWFFKGNIDNKARGQHVLPAVGLTGRRATD
jgi:hypothetical protein